MKKTSTIIFFCFIVLTLQIGKTFSQSTVRIPNPPVYWNLLPENLRNFLELLYVNIYEFERESNLAHLLVGIVNVGPTRIPTNTPTQIITPTTVVSGELPSSILDLTNWKITLPIGSGSSPTEIKQPALNTYALSPWFITIPGAVRFRAPVNGKTTSGSSYPRSELREMTSNGTSNASWSTSQGRHVMTIDQAITAVPRFKKHVVAGQIHDANDDVIVIRLEYPKLFVDINGTDGPTLDSNYTLGKRFNVRFEVENNQTSIFYNNSSTPSYVLNQSYSGAYFKAGAYTQSNCSTEQQRGGTTNDCSNNNYGEVVIYNLNIQHQ